MSFAKQLPLLLILFSLSACSAVPAGSRESQPVTLAQIQKQWQLVAIDGQAIDSGINSTLRVDTQAQAAGKLACNNFFGTLILQNNSLKMEPMGSTRMMCPKPMDDIEMVVAGVLNDWSEIQFSAAELTLSGKKHTLTYRIK